MSINKIAISFCLTIVAITPAVADLIVYPSQGQSDEQMAKDKFECQRWATEQTGFDPLATPRANTPPPAAEGSSNFLEAVGCFSTDRRHYKTR